MGCFNCAPDWFVKFFLRISKFIAKPSLTELGSRLLVDMKMHEVGKLVFLYFEQARSAIPATKLTNNLKASYENVRHKNLEKNNSSKILESYEFLELFQVHRWLPVLLRKVAIQSAWSFLKISFRFKFLSKSHFSHEAVMFYSSQGEFDKRRNFIFASSWIFRENHRFHLLLLLLIGLITFAFRENTLTWNSVARVEQRRKVSSR